MHKIRPALFSADIFKPNDIRGVYPSELSEKAAYAIARSFVGYLLLRKPDHQKVQVVVSHDAEESSVALYNAFIGGLLDEGADVIDMGAAIPSVNYFAIAHTHTDGGAAFSSVVGGASQISLSSGGAAPVGEGLGLEEIRNAALRGIFTSIGGSATLQSGIRIQRNFLGDYAEFFVKAFHDIQNFSINIAIAGIGSALTVVKKIMKQFPHIEVEYGGNAPTTGRMSIYFTDNERVTFFDEMGKEIPFGAMVAFFVGELTRAGDHVVYDLRTSRVVGETAISHDGVAHPCRVGDVFVRDLMRREDAVFGADASGHYYFKNFFYVPSGIYTALTLLSILAKKTTPLSQLVAPYIKYAKSSEMNFKVKDKEQCVDSLAAFFHDASLSYEDGLSVHYEDWWCNVRPSSTEDFLRVNVEADTQDLLDKKIKLLRELIEKSG